MIKSINNIIYIRQPVLSSFFNLKNELPPKEILANLLYLGLKRCFLRKY